MATARFTETLEVGNWKTGEYHRWTKRAEFEGTAQEVGYLIETTSRLMQLPALTPYGQLSGSGIIAGFRKRRKLNE